jgi:hypothetical protein
MFILIILETKFFLFLNTNAVGVDVKLYTLFILELDRSEWSALHLCHLTFQGRHVLYPLKTVCIGHNAITGMVVQRGIPVLWSGVETLPPSSWSTTLVINLFWFLINE